MKVPQLLCSNPRRYERERLMAAPILSPEIPPSERHIPSPFTPGFIPVNSTFRDVHKDVAIILLHTLVTGSQVQLDVSLPLAVCGLPHGTTSVMLCPPALQRSAW